MQHLSNKQNINLKIDDFEKNKILFNEIKSINPIIQPPFQYLQKSAYCICSKFVDFLCITKTIIFVLTTGFWLCRLIFKFRISDLFVKFASEI